MHTTGKPILYVLGNQCSISHFLASLGVQEKWYCTHIAHQCCDQLTAVKTGYRWPASPDRIAGSGVNPSRSSIFEVICWQVTSFQMIVGSSFLILFFMKYVMFMCRSIQILTLNWPRTRKFSQLLQAGKTVAFDFPLHGRALVTLYVQFSCSDWSKFERWVQAENICSILNLV